jgi:hypothetical protein
LRDSSSPKDREAWRPVVGIVLTVRAEERLFFNGRADEHHDGNDEQKATAKEPTGRQKKESDAEEEERKIHRMPDIRIRTGFHDVSAGTNLHRAGEISGQVFLYPDKESDAENHGCDAEPTRFNREHDLRPSHGGRPHHIGQKSYADRQAEQNSKHAKRSLPFRVLFHARHGIGIPAGIHTDSHDDEHQ